MAFVQGGLDPSFHPHVRQLAALHIEPLHLLVRPALHDLAAANLTALRGKTVNLGPDGSGTQDLARDVLSFAGLEPAGENRPGGYQAMTLSYGELLVERDPARLPDAVFSVSALPSPIVRTLAVRHHYRLVALPFGDAFALDALNRGPSDVREGRPGPRSDVSKVKIYPAVIPPFTYGVEPPTPPREVGTFGPRLLLVTRENVRSRPVRQILETVFSPTFAQISKPPLDATLLEMAPEYPLHPGALEYIQFNKPLMAGDVIDLLEKGASLAGAIVGALFFLWQWMRQHFRRKRELGFESYMLKVAAIEEKALALEMMASLEVKELLSLQRELGRLKNEALARFAEGKLEGGQLLSGFVSHVNDSRNYLNRLILHERDNLEDRVKNERRSAQSVWTEALSETNAATAASGEGQLAACSDAPPGPLDASAPWPPLRKSAESR